LRDLEGRNEGGGVVEVGYGAKAGCPAGTVMPSWPTMAMTQKPRMHSAMALRRRARQSRRGMSTTRLTAASATITAKSPTLATSSSPYRVSKIEEKSPTVDAVLAMPEKRTAHTAAIPKVEKRRGAARRSASSAALLRLRTEMSGTSAPSHEAAASRCSPSTHR